MPDTPHSCTNWRRCPDREAVRYADWRRMSSVDGGTSRARTSVSHIALGVRHGRGGGQSRDERVVGLAEVLAGASGDDLVEFGASGAERVVAIEDVRGAPERPDAPLDVGPQRRAMSWPSSRVARPGSIPDRRRRNYSRWHRYPDDRTLTRKGKHPDRLAVRESSQHTQGHDEEPSPARGRRREHSTISAGSAAGCLALRVSEPERSYRCCACTLWARALLERC